MTRTIVFLILITLTFSFSSAQNCKFLFDIPKNTKFEFSYFDANGNLTGTAEKQLLDKKNYSDSAVYFFQSKLRFTNSDSIIKSTYSIICKNNFIYFDFSEIIPAGEQYSINAENLEIPANLQVGQKLKNGTLSVKDLKNNITIKSKIYNRIVENYEILETPAGKFEAFKIRYDMTTKIGFISLKSSATEWYSPTYGLIMSETYDDKGNLTSNMILTKITNE